MSSLPHAAPEIRTDVTFERTMLDEHSWVDVARGWLQNADILRDSVLEHGSFTQSRLFRYERYVDEPRLGMWCRPPQVPDPALLEIQRTITARYRVRFDEGFALAWYRDGRDSVAFHRDRDMRWLDDTVIAILTLGARRPFLLRPRSNRYAHDLPAKGATHDLAPASGDLLVMGGACQAGWEHSVPKIDRPVGARVSAQWRWTSRRGRQEIGGSYRKPRHFSR